jgi:hypothetical protein
MGAGDTASAQGDKAGGADAPKAPPPLNKQQTIFCSMSSKSFSVVKGQIPPELETQLTQTFTEEEVQRCYGRANKLTAPKGLERPRALWIFGPSAVGKSFLTARKAAELFGALENAVQIDGSEFRLVHAGFQAVAAHGQSQCVLHADAWPKFKSTALEDSSDRPTLKKRLLKETLADRQNVVIPDCANNPKKLQAYIELVRSAGYEMHAVCLWAPLSVTRGRGEGRSVREGKLWNPKDYDTSTHGSVALARQFLDGMRDEPNSFHGVEFWDNTALPATKLELEQFTALVNLSHGEADAHAERLVSKQKERQLWRRAVLAACVAAGIAAAFALHRAQ